MSTSFYTPEELLQIGFKSVGHHVYISRKASIYTVGSISIGNHVRIDDFCILSGEISIGSYIHISAYTAIYAKYGVEIQDFCTVSGRVMIYSQNDDYSGNFLTNPMVPGSFSNISGAPVVLKKHAIVGVGSVILPGVTLGSGACVGAMSFVKSNVPDWTVFGGVPARKIGERKQNILKLEEQLKDSL